MPVRSRMVIVFAVVLSLFAGLSASAQARNASPAGGGDCRPIFCDITDVPGLPRVLLIGDSISIQYTRPVRKLLAGKANVHRIPRNGGSTRLGLRFLDQWIGKGNWKVIHVNFGIHDARYTRRGVPAVSLDQYKRNVKIVLDRLKATGARVIWATTTPIPASAETGNRKWADATAYNDAATAIAKKEGVAIDDLYAVAKPREQALQRPANVHFTRHGSAVLAAQVARSIEAALNAGN